MHSIGEDMDATRSEVTNDTTGTTGCVAKRWAASTVIDASKSAPVVSLLNRKFHHNSLLLSLKERIAQLLH